MFVWFPIVALLAGSPSADSAQNARTLLERAIAAQGGDALRNLRSLEMETAGHAYAIEQSERPEGPFVVIYLKGKQLRDYGGRRLRSESQMRAIQAPDWSPATTVVMSSDAVAMPRGDRWVPGTRAQLDSAQRDLELSPERVALTALAAADLGTEPDEPLRGMHQHVVSFGWRGRRVRVLLNPFNALPTAVDVIGPDPLFSMWGVVTERTMLSYWNLEAGGIRYPRQQDVFWNGVTKSVTNVTVLRVDPPADAAAFAIPEETRQAFAAAKPAGFETARLDLSRAQELVPGIVLLPGSWNTTLVRQPDGIVILEAPISSGYSAQVLDEAARRFPGVKVKAAITTSDAWPHLGGVREYVARGIPIYALDLNRPILERLIAAPYGTTPDALARSPRAPKFTWLSSKTVIGSGDNRLELYPIRGENGERMVMAYFPAHRVLYSSDELQRLRSGEFFMPQFLLEARDAVEREGLQVDRVFGMHLAVTPWTEVDAAIAKASARPGAASPSSGR